MIRITKKGNACLLLLLCFTQINQGQPSVKTVKNFITRRHASIADSANEFAFSLQKTYPPNGNVIFSPWAVAFALGMIALGAEGKTLQQMREAMFLTHISPDNIHYGFKQLREHLVPTGDDYEMNMFSIVLTQEKHNISPVYKLKLKRYYDADIHDVDFNQHGELVTKWINAWTSLKTGGKIENIMTAVPDPNTVMLLLTANYFKGIWEESFSPNETVLDNFYNDDGSISQVDMMHATRNMSVYAGEQYAIDAVDVPMKGDISFLFIIPQKMDEMAVLQHNLSNHFLSEIYREMSVEPVNLSLPKFRASSRIELHESLQALGIIDLFSPVNANLSSISNIGELSVQDVIHKAFLELDENGAVAASITVTSIISRIKAYKLHINRPFIFIIREIKSGTILFMGRVSKL